MVAPISPRGSGITIPDTLIWHTASPEWDFDDATFDRSARSFENPDHVAIVIHNYRWRLGLADGERRLDSPIPES
jgi:hypothetical protein